MNNDNTKIIEEDVYNILSTVMDPEIEIDIINLGLIYDLKYNGNNNIVILMTFSTPACPLSDAIKQNITESIKNKYPNFKVDIQVTFNPTWSSDLISDKGKKMLGM